MSGPNVRPGFRVQPVVGPRHWRVEVFSDGEQLIAIEPEMLAGKSDLTDEDLSIIRSCAEHLRSFSGSGEPAPCFVCDDTGIDGYDEHDRPVACPVCGDTFTWPNAPVKAAPHSGVEP